MIDNRTKDTIEMAKSGSCWGVFFIMVRVIANVEIVSSLLWRINEMADVLLSILIQKSSDWEFNSSTAF